MDDKKKKKVALHTYDIWPPPQESQKIAKEKKKIERDKPRNTTYVDPAIALEHTEAPVYDVEEPEHGQTEEEKDKHER